MSEGTENHTLERREKRTGNRTGRPEPTLKVKWWVVERWCVGQWKSTTQPGVWLMKTGRSRVSVWMDRHEFTYSL